MSKTTVTLNREKETKNKVRFEEEGDGEKVIGTLYIDKKAAGKAASIRVTIEEL